MVKSNGCGFKSFCFRVMAMWSVVLATMPGCSGTKVQLQGDLKSEAEERVSEDTAYQAPTGLPGPRAYAHYLKSKLLALDGDLAGAIREMKTALIYDDGPDLHTALGRLYWRRGMFRQALDEAGLAIADDPEHAEAFRLVADCYRDMKEFSKAVEKYETALELAQKRVNAIKGCSCSGVPGSGACAEACTLANELFFELGRLHTVLGGVKEARKVFKAWADFNPASSEPRFHLGRLAEERKDLDRAEKWYREALDADPYDSMAFTALSSLLERRGKYKEAIEVWIQGLEHGGDGVEARLHIGELYLKLGDAKNAETYFNDAISAKPDSSIVRFRVGAILYDAGMFKQAEQQFRKGLKEAGSDARGRYLLALTLYRVGRMADSLAEVSKIGPDADEVYKDATKLKAELFRRAGKAREAVAQLKEIYSEDKTDLTVAADLAMAMFDAGMVDESLEMVNRLLELGSPPLDPDDLRSLSFTYSILLERAGRTDQSLALLEKLLAQDPDDPMALNFLGYTLAERGRDLDRAEELIRKALEKDPDNGYIMDSLGWVVFKKGDVERALNLLQQADRKAPHNPEILEHIAACELALGKRKEARDLLRSALKLWPEPWVRRRIQKKLKELEH